MKRVKSLVIIIGLLLGFSGCEREVNTTLKPVHWDRDMCERCKMVVSDRKHAVQVINPQDGRSYMFDDLGCMVLWFHNEAVPWASTAVIWITDAASGAWIDARKAFYDSGNITPMAYGYAAHAKRSDIEKEKKVLTFSDVSQEILASQGGGTR